MPQPARRASGKKPRGGARRRRNRPTDGRQPGPPVAGAWILQGAPGGARRALRANHVLDSRAGRLDVNLALGEAERCKSWMTTSIGSQQKQSPEEGIPEGGPIPLHRDIPIKQPATTVRLRPYTLVYTMSTCITPAQRDSVPSCLTDSSQRCKPRKPIAQRRRGCLVFVSIR